MPSHAAVILLSIGVICTAVALILHIVADRIRRGHFEDTE